MKKTGDGKNMVVVLLVLSCWVTAIACNRQTPPQEEALEAAIETGEDAAEPDLKYDLEFASEMAERSLMDMQLGELAQARAESAKVKALASDIAKEHKKSMAELKAWATARGNTLPDELGEKNQQVYDELAEYEGKDFDEAYTNYLVAVHRQKIRKLERESETGRDPDLRDWAAGKIHLWEQHLDKAQQAKKETADAKD